MKKIKCTKGLVALVDDKDYENLSRWKWFYYHGYAARLDNGKFVAMHQYILKAPKGMEIDHKDGNKVNNQRSNLRVCTHAENTKNKSTPSNNTSGYKGVYWNINSKKWIAIIRSKKKSFHLGCFQDVKDAARAYNKGALKHHGKFARLNEVT